MKERGQSESFEVHQESDVSWKPTEWSFVGEEMENHPEDINTLDYCQ